MPYTSLGHLEVDLVIDAMKRGESSIEAFGQTVGVSSTRIRTFLKGTCCVVCNKQGHFFSVEKQLNDHGDKYHLNLYHQTKDGLLVMLTSDHIIAKSRGGSDTDPENRQPMCGPCNSRKGNRLPGEPEGLNTVLPTSLSKLFRLDRAYIKLCQGLEKHPKNQKIQRHMRANRKRFTEKVWLLTKNPALKDDVQLFIL